MNRVLVDADILSCYFKVDETGSILLKYKPILEGVSKVFIGYLPGL